MKFFLLSLLIVLSGAAKEIKSDLHLNVTYGGSLSTVIVGHVLGSMGFKADIHRFSNIDEMTQMELVLYAKKPFDPKAFTQELNAHHIMVRHAELQNREWTMELDASQASWNLPAITQDEGAQVERTNVPVWFKVNQTVGIAVEAPYNSKWYPEIAVLDDKMNVLASLKESTSTDRMAFLLPERAMYLKVSNANGMKMLKEGMWIESANQEQ